MGIGQGRRGSMGQLWGEAKMHRLCGKWDSEQTDSAQG